MLALALVYMATAKGGLMLGAVSGFATLVWPPTGIRTGDAHALGDVAMAERSPREPSSAKIANGVSVLDRLGNRHGEHARGRAGSLLRDASGKPIPLSRPRRRFIAPWPSSQARW